MSRPMRFIASSSVTFEVEAYFWQTVWFYLLAALCAALVIGLLVRWMLRHRYQMQMAVLKREEALAQERARISRDIHDDLGNGLSVVATLSELAQNEVEKPAAHKRLDQIYDVANELARNGEIVWAVNPANDGWEPFVSYFEAVHRIFSRQFGIAVPLRSAARAEGADHFLEDAASPFAGGARIHRECAQARGRDAGRNHHARGGTRYRRACGAGVCAGLAGVERWTGEGVEFNILGLNFGVDPNSPALRLPAIGRLGMSDVSVSDVVQVSMPGAE